MDIWAKRIGVILIVAVIAAGFYLAFREKPILVDIAKVEIGPMQVTIDEEGVARVRDTYIVSSPISGHLDRTKLEEGEPVIANETIIASIHPLDPPFLDKRTEAELEAALEAAKSAFTLAKVERAQAQTALEQAESDYRRTLELSKTNVVSESKLERAYSELKLQQAQVESRDAVIRLRQAEIISAEIRLQQPNSVSMVPRDKGCCVHLISPIDGVVLKVLARSEQAVTPGTSITEVGDPQNIEIAVDLLSSDTPRLKMGSKVEISDWGGDNVLEARIRRINPAAFTKVSSLGIEEQRVDVILDLKTVPKSIGHGYRVLAKLEVWSTESALQVPVGALFRSNGDWAVFTVDDGVARLQTLKLGHINNQMAEVYEGLASGQEVVLYPSDLLEDGRLISIR
ncbi:HlyD family efflux transporter periplasmic adaptor subunit [Amylibacter sp. SFDW26]|uniref:efflux RND transporter periplasmic adaptor subunit n=1 Tax=Amylibacter sp. SFDW26 TaxID=2652722 RepID=UPI001261642E|nr:HlyD family efflux transporter periplasmic adaptor subunit [Amylibacter sp. SFDW26]KAB7614430.1 HlyD family efflux transporter periplasmic adaptor subunit [Amylibacter sp. SFDW26]